MAQTRATPTSAARRARSRTRPTSPNSTVAARTKSPVSPVSPSTARSPSRRRATSTTRSSTASSGWAYTPSQLTLLWLVGSVACVLWDTGYVLLRPHTMPGGRLHSPIYKPYALYGSVDYVYGWKAFKAGDGFPSAQAWMNLVESVAYITYLYMVFTRGTLVKAKGRGPAPPKGVLDGIPVLEELTKARLLTGRDAAETTLLLYTTVIMTLAKTLLYMLNETCSGFANVGHNDIQSLVFLYLIPNGMWIVVPSYLLYFLTHDMLRGLELAAVGGSKRSR